MSSFAPEDRIDGLIALSAQILNHALASAVALHANDAASHRFDSAFLEIPSSEKLGALVKGGRYPRGFIELNALLEKTGLEDLHVISQESIMKLGSLRECKEGRAEAIMSVIGATGWYVEGLQSESLEELEKNLVLGLYPLRFLQETAELVGARFYNFIVVRDRVGHDLTTDTLVSGSLLPFSTHSNQESVSEEIFLPRSQLDEGDHPSVKLWAVEADGSVSIPKAAILTPTSDQEVMPLIASVTLAYPTQFGLFQTHEPAGQPGDRNRSIDLREWERSWLPTSKDFAVALMNATFLDRDYVRGVLLKETSDVALIKVGVFATRGLFPQEGAMTRIFKTRAVNWRVL